MAVTVSHPIQTLREHSTNFEAALSVCLADPKVKAVHKLRTESRRLEAQIALLKQVKGLPPFRTEAAKALLQIKKVRQAAGRVRDLDVQAQHLKDHAKKIRARSLTDEEKQVLLGDLDAMLKTRDERRVRASAKLVAEIGGRQQKVSAALEELNSALKPVAAQTLPSAELLAIAKKQFERAHGLKLKKPNADDLHTVRKAAKQARYLAENAGAKTAAEVAKRYEHLQELGGAWHDWLELSSAARRELGKKHKTATDFVVLRDHNLQRYRAELAVFTPEKAKQAKQTKRKSPSKKK